MFNTWFSRLLLPRSLRRQFIYALSTLAFLAVAGGLMALYALRVAVDSTQQLAGERLVRMQDSQELVQRTLLIERDVHRMLEGQSLDAMRGGYADIIERLAVIDQLVERLVKANDDIRVLALHQASQLFRNTTNIVASLRESVLQAQADDSGHSPPVPRATAVKPSERLAQEENIRHFHLELQRQASAMVTSAQSLSAHFTQDYQDALGQLVETSRQNQRWVLVLLAGCLLLAWLVTRYLFGQHVLNRLHHVSHYLRSGGDSTHVGQRVPVDGSDEIAQMARAVELFMEDRHQLALVNMTLETERARQEELIKQLAQVHGQLLQSEKMASIGQLAAGVAHEINNPIGFVTSNLSSLRRYVDDLCKVVSAYEAGESELQAQTRAAVDALKQEIDMGFLRQDVADLLTESMDGMQRVKRIVQDLMDFARVGESEKQWANLERGLDSTLNVVSNELKYKATVVKAYGDIPDVECIPSQLNQVFMNLLMNAVQAIDVHGTITVRTGRDGGKVWVEIQDTGCGIKPEHLGRIFDPFFTTKAVGKGSGLGLALSYGIVKKHDGEITVKSDVGVGSVFRVTLPIQAPAHA
ncbi:ATP-binding protein [Rhodoferax sp.]|uniref:ATP-binding protein n=1 Tax=Rhodoferax sp. TaxID=50421 RepID=UPI00260C87E3|nr:ATP-binding protein [Rhodoferax sp.]MDD2925955.1 ATP-binding protein [Rhodoferax sp.]